MCHQLKQNKLTTKINNKRQHTHRMMITAFTIIFQILLIYQIALKCEINNNNENIPSVKTLSLSNEPNEPEVDGWLFKLWLFDWNWMWWFWFWFVAVADKLLYIKPFNIWINKRVYIINSALTYSRMALPTIKLFYYKLK